jgi:uncharacterized protein (DUF362 family)
VDERRVAIERGTASYPSRAPFDPGEAYPELGGRVAVGGEPNAAYALVRAALASLGLDAARYGTAAWNPLGGFVRPGDTVVVKPNLIRESHLQRDEWQQIVTHGSVVRAIVDYVLLAAGDAARVVICDGPQTDSDFAAICERNGLFAVVDHYRRGGRAVELLDLRRDRWYEQGGVLARRETLPGDPAGYTTVELGERSEFHDYALSGRFYGADYDMAETRRYHENGRHAYVLCRTVMDADVVINVPKLKTHKKTGVTLSLKNLVGVNGYRNCLPHHTIGTPHDGGDEFPATDVKHRIQSRAIVGFKRALVRRGGTGGAWARWAKRVGARIFGSTDRVVRSGNWHGNDTLWRTVLDLNKCVLCYDGDGRERDARRRYLTIVDGIVAGEGDGPMACDAKPAGVIVAGCNPVAVDTAIATLMGFDAARIPVLAHAWRARGHAFVDFAPADIARASSTWPDAAGTGLDEVPDLGFRPHFGWRGAIERRATAAA